VGSARKILCQSLGISNGLDSGVIDCWVYYSVFISIGGGGFVMKIKVIATIYIKHKMPRAI